MIEFILVASIIINLVLGFIAYWQHTIIVECAKERGVDL